MSRDIDEAVEKVIEIFDFIKEDKISELSKQIRILSDHSESLTPEGKFDVEWLRLFTKELEGVLNKYTHIIERLGD